MYDKHELLALAIRLILLVLIMAVIPVAGLYWHTGQLARVDAQDEAIKAGRLFERAWRQEGKLLSGRLDLLERIPCIQDAFAARERDRLLQCAEPLYADMQARQPVTHFYFHSPDRTVFLRLHHPMRHGDPIQRVTLDRAVETGQEAQGVELGTFGIFTLRVVRPLYADGRLLGYLELGEEIPHITKGMKSALGVDLMFLVRKELVSRGKWEEGQKIMGHPGDWDEFPNMVVSDRTSYLWSPDLREYVQWQHEEMASEDLLMTFGDQDLRVSSLPLLDAGDQTVGNIVVLADVTEERSSLRLFMLTLFSVLLAVGALFATTLLLNFRHALRNASISQAAESDERQIVQLTQRNESLTRDLQRYQRAAVEAQVLDELLRLAVEPTALEHYLHTSLERLVSSIVWLDHLPEAVFFTVSRQGERNELELAASYNFSQALRQRCARVPFGTCLCGRSAASRETIFCNQVDDRHDIDFDGMVPHGHYVIPVEKENELLGVFNLYLPVGATRDERDETFLLRVVKVLADGIWLRRHSGMAGG